MAKYKNEFDITFTNFTKKPDIYIERHNLANLIIDTKYKKIDSIRSDYRDNTKGQVSQSDVYRMFAYSQYYSTPKGILLYPKYRVDLHLDDVMSFSGFKSKLKCQLAKLA